MTDEQRWNPDELRLDIARDLRAIGDLIYDLHAQAIASANDHEFPGGTALHMLAPAASIAEWEAQYEDTETRERWDEKGKDTWQKQPKLDPATYQGDAEEHPLNVLESWTRMIREERGQPTNEPATISRELTYLHGSLDWTLRITDNNEPAWPLVFEMRGELHALVRSMERVVHDGPQIDRGVGCLECGQELLKIWGIDPGTDRYVCTAPECGKRYNPEEYMDAVERSYLLNAEWLTAGQAAAVYRKPAGTILSWVQRGYVRKKKHPEFKRMVYNVADIVARRDAEARDESASEGA